MRGYFVIIGMALAIWQIVATRELFPILRSCEPLIVASLGVTTFFLAVGIFLGPSAQAPERRRIGLFGVVLWAAGFLPPIQLGCIRFLDKKIPFFPGSPLASLILCAVAAAPFAVVAGLLIAIFSAGGKRVHSRIHEALALLGTGAGVGGVLFSVFLADLLPVFLTTLSLSLLLFTAVVLLFGRRDTPRFLLGPSIISWTAVILAIAVAYSPIRKFIVKEPGEGERRMPSAAGTAGKVEAEVNEKQVNVFLNRVSVTPWAGTKEVAHIPMLQHSMPRTVLVIGGSGPELVGEILRHNVESVRYFHVDPAVVALMLKYSPNREALCSAVVEPQSPLEDARAYVQEGRDKFDVVIIDIPLPGSAAMNRFFTAEFFLALRGIVRETGFAAVTLRLPKDPKPEARSLAGSILTAFASAFPDYILAIGEVRLLIGSVSGLGPTIDPGVLANRCQERGMSADEFGKPEFVRGEPPAASGGANRDFTPWPYRLYFDSWTAFDRNYFALSNIVVAAAISAVVVFVLGLIIGRRNVAAACAGMIFGGAAGGLLLASELLALQAIYGSLYRQIAFMIGVAAIGLCMGEAIGNAGNARRQRRYVALASALGALALLSLLLPKLLEGMVIQGDPWWLANIRVTLPFLGGVVAFLLAFSFAAAGTMIGLPESLFMALVSAAVGLICGAILFATGASITFPSDVAAVLSAAGAGVVIILAQT